jgi:hypothetical protein
MLIYLISFRIKFYRISKVPYIITLFGFDHAFS